MDIRGFLILAAAVCFGVDAWRRKSWMSAAFCLLALALY